MGARITRGMIVWLMAVALFVAAVQPSYAVDKKKKDQATKKVVDTVKKKESTNDAEQSKAKAANKKYDSFVDKNKNGIDDRRENLRTKQVAKPRVDSAKTASTKKTDTAKTASKKDTSKSSSTKSDSSKKSDKEKK